MKYTLFQTNKLVDYRNLSDINKVIEQLPYKPTAYIEANDLSDVYGMTQHGTRYSPPVDIDGFQDTGNWVGILVKGIMPAIRSTCVGDIIVDENKSVYVVAFSDFDRAGTVSEIQKMGGLEYLR